MQVDTIILAGAKNDGKLQEVSSSQYEALITINGKTMLSYVVEALQESDYVRKIVVVGYSALRSHLSDDVILLECGESLVDNIQVGIDYLGVQKPVLVVTSDIPMLTSEAINDFVYSCQDLKKDLFYPIISKEDNERVYPGVERTYVQLKDGVYTGGNMVLIGPNFVEESRQVVQQVVALRKKPFAIIKMLGFGIIIKYILHRLSIADVERRVEILFGISAKAVMTSYPQIGTDIDKPSDLELAEKILAYEEIGYA